jgi:hypothetical protein
VAETEDSLLVPDIFILTGIRSGHALGYLYLKDANSNVGDCNRAIVGQRAHEQTLIYLVSN